MCQFFFAGQIADHRRIAITFTAIQAQPGGILLIAKTEFAPEVSG